MMSNNLYSMIGGFRLVILAWRYDIVILVIFLLLPKMLIMIRVMYYILSCEVRRTPIDLVEGESELVSGFNTEFSGGEFVRFFLGEYLGIIILLVMVVSSEVYVVVFLYGLVILVRGSYPRMKYNEVVLSIWKYIVLLVIVGYLL